MLYNIRQMSMFSELWDSIFYKSKSEYAAETIAMRWNLSRYQSRLYSLHTTNVVLAG
jgi:hypothetical protein